MTPPTAPIPPYGALWYVAAVNLVIWAGLFAYLLYLDRKVSRARMTIDAGGPR
jgi:CcmD family protein